MAVGEPGHEELVEELILLLSFDSSLARTARLAKANTSMQELQALKERTIASIQSVAELNVKLRAMIEEYLPDFYKDREML